MGVETPHLLLADENIAAVSSTAVRRSRCKKFCCGMLLCGVLIVALLVFFGMAHKKHNNSCSDASLNEYGDWGVIEAVNDVFNISTITIDTNDDDDSNYSDTSDIGATYRRKTYKYELCFINNTNMYDELKLTYDSKYRIIGGVTNQFDCAEHCSDSVFDLPSSLNSDYNDESGSNRILREYYVWEPFYVYWQNSTSMCYCQGLINATDNEYGGGWIEWNVKKYFNVVEYEYLYNVSTDQQSGKEIVVDKTLLGVKRLGNAQCDIRNGDVWLNFTDWNDFNISYFEYSMVCY